MGGQKWKSGVEGVPEWSDVDSWSSEHDKLPGGSISSTFLIYQDLSNQSVAPSVSPRHLPVPLSQATQCWHTEEFPRCGVNCVKGPETERRCAGVTPVAALCAPPHQTSGWGLHRTFSLVIFQSTSGSSTKVNAIYCQRIVFILLLLKKTFL